MLRSLNPTVKGFCFAEVDDREVANGGLNSKTSFFATGDPVAYLIFRGPGVTVDDQIHSMVDNNNR